MSKRIFELIKSMFTDSEGIIYSGSEVLRRVQLAEEKEKKRRMRVRILKNKKEV